MNPRIKASEQERNGAAAKPTPAEETL